MDQRSDADYSGEVSFTADTVEGIMQNVMRFNEHLLEILTKEGFSTT